MKAKILSDNANTVIVCYCPDKLPSNELIPNITVIQWAKKIITRDKNEYDPIARFIITLKV